MADIPLYERLSNESPQAFQAFTIYRDLGPDRSLAEVSRRLTSSADVASQVIFVDQATNRQRSGNKKPGGNLTKWSTQFNWVTRAQAWDDYVDQRLRAKQLDEIERMAKRQAQESVIASSLLTAPMLSFSKAVQQDPSKLAPDVLAVGIMRDLLELGQRSASLLPRVHDAERTARGIRIDKKAKTSPQQGRHWLVEMYQPERKESDTIEDFQPQSVSTEWPGDPGGRVDDD